MEHCYYCKLAIVYEEGIPGAWRLADRNDSTSFACSGWFQGMHQPAEVR